MMTKYSTDGSSDINDLSLDDSVEFDNGLSNDQISNVKFSIRKLDKYPLEETKTRNIIMLGKSGSGKTTAVQVLKDICSEPRPQSLFSDTVGAKFQSFSLDDKDNKVKYTLNIIDTPGVQEVRPIGEDARSDEAIIETIKYCLKNEIVRIHTLLIFASFENRINKSDIDAFKIYLDMFYNTKTNIAFCITRAEGRPKDWKTQIINDLNSHEYFKDVLSKKNIGIFFTGCVSTIRAKEAKDEKTLFRYYNEIYNLRKGLLKFIFDSNDDGVMLIDLPVASGKKIDMKNILEIQKSIINKIKNTNDVKTGSIKQEAQIFSDNIDYMVKNEGLFNDSELLTMFIDMKKQLKEIIPKLDDELKTLMCSKLVL